jgi:hypothetical protein
MIDLLVRNSLGSTASPPAVQSSHEEGELAAGGIADWPSKRAALWTIYGGVSSNRELAHKITLGMPNPSSGASVLERCVECLSKTWPKYRPRGGYSLEFRDRIITQINKLIRGNLPNPTGEAIVGPMTADVFVNQPYSTFRRIFPQNPWGTILAVAAGEERLESRNDRFTTENKNKATYLQHVSSELTFELPKAAIARGKVDQKLYYGNYEAVDNWEGVISARRYALYGHCRDALISVTQTDIWQDFFAKHNGCAIVMLGGGSASKDLILIQSALEKLPVKERLWYTIADYSFAMSHSARRLVDANLRREGLASRITLDTAWCDFLQLEEVTKAYRPDGARTAWLIPGNTFGNLDEGRFLASIRNEAEEGDILVIGVETIDPKQKPTSIREARTRYKIAEVYEFVSPALMAVWHGLGTTASIKSLKQRIDTRICSEKEHSAVPGSITIELFLDLSKIPKRRIKRRPSRRRAPKRSLTLLTSTKYDPTNLIGFVERFGLKSEAIVDAPQFAHYKQFVFRFLPK